ncbi:hypothetical protein L6164_007730 [Bauhinia variegata]|uniref:Uncharacterized protein n=1 Tax=Bauhinia variegata TaxID=167791 RepID=A0ACB9PEM9_BAUVA|nr:hypothetical protein L6164_007730 [Bauhinia variegata]
MELDGFSSTGDSDDELFLQNASDSEEESHYLSDIIPKLQFRNVKSRASWNDEMGMAEITEKKGKMWITTGIVRQGKTYCSIEETLYLMELGALDVVDNGGKCINLTDLYSKVAGRKGGCSWELFEVYRHLKSLGYIVGWHGVPWSLKGAKSAHAPVFLGGTEESKQLVDVDSQDELSINMLFSKMHINEARPDFEVYLPNSKFRKSSPGDPSFLLYLSRGNPPSGAEMDVLERQCDGIPLKICLVEYSIAAALLLHSSLRFGLHYQKMFFLCWDRPSAQNRKDCINKSGTFNYDSNYRGATAKSLSSLKEDKGLSKEGFLLNHARVLVGSGQETFEKGKSALRSWRFNWAFVDPKTPIQKGLRFCVCVEEFFPWLMMPLEVMYVNERSSAKNRLPSFGFGSGTLQGHLLAGEERFSIEMDEKNQVWYEIVSFSQPANILSFVGYPYVVLRQKHFARESTRAVLKHINS